MFRHIYIRSHEHNTAAMPVQPSRTKRSYSHPSTIGKHWATAHFRLGAPHWGILLMYYVLIDTTKTCQKVFRTFSAHRKFLANIYHRRSVRSVSLLIAVCFVHSTYYVSLWWWLFRLIYLWLTPQNTFPRTRITFPWENRNKSNSTITIKLKQRR